MACTDIHFVLLVGFKFGIGTIVSYMARICYWHLRHLWFEGSLPKVERNLIKFGDLQILFVRLDLFQAKGQIC